MEKYREWNWNRMSEPYNLQRGKQKLASLASFSDVPHVSIGLKTSGSNHVEPKMQPHTFPEIREIYYGETLTYRSQIKEIGSSGGDSVVGPPDLVHWAKYSGVRSALYTNNDFTIGSSNIDTSKDDDGYLGFYHYVNGIGSIDFVAEVEDYILKVIGLVKENNEYYFTQEMLNSDKYSTSKREVVVTYCSYNIFNKSDFRTRYVIHLNGSTKRSPIQIGKSYQIVSYSSDRKVTSFNANTVQDIPSPFWDELKASQIIRLFNHLDNPAQQLTGLVSYPNFIDSKQSLTSSIEILVKFLSRGNICGTKIGYGASTNCGTKGDICSGTNGNANISYRKTNSYRNHLIDSILRLCRMDISGETCNFAVNEIRKRFYTTENIGEWDYVILQIYKITPGFNKEQQFLNLVHDHLKQELYTTQLSLILLEQVKFLISKQNYELALIMAQKCVSLLPLDFECWYTLALTYCLNNDYRNAILTFNSIPIIINNRDRSQEIDIVSNVKDFYLSMFLQRVSINSEEVISEKTFYNYFPSPKISGHKQKKSIEIEDGSIKKMWRDMLLFNPHLRHPICGHHWYQSPIMNCSPMELSSVDSSLIKSFTSSSKMMYSKQSSGSPSTSVLDFDKASTWGRCYDLLASIVAMIGWDTTLQIKNDVFTNKETINDKEYVVNHEKGSVIHCEGWLDQLFLVLFEDLRTMINSTSSEIREHSAIEWGMIGLLGWSVKYNLRESISSLITSVVGTSNQGGFDYFGTVQLLEIYNEFILSEVVDTNIDLLNDSYDLRFFSNKLTLKQSGYSEVFLKSLEQDYLTLDFILLILLKLISWNFRWYQYTPNFTIVRTLTKLIIKYDLVFILTSFRIIFEQNKNNSSTKKSSMFGNLLGSSTKKSKSNHKYEFVDEDTIIDYVERIICWIDDLKN